MPYLLCKALHVAFVLIFTGGLFVQAFGVAAGACGDAVALRLASRWDQTVTTPAMLMAWLSGAVVASEGGWFSHPWLWAKLVLVVALSVIHGFQSGRLRRLRSGGRVKGPGDPRSIPTIIVLAMAVIALLAVAKPG